MNDEQGPAPGPEPLPEPGPVSVPAAAQALGISERAVRKRIHAGTLRAQPFGRSFMVWLLDDSPAAGPEPGPAPRPEHGPVPGPEPIEAAYRVTPVEIEQAIERTGQKYVTDMAALYDRISAEVGKLYEGQLAAKDETIATQRAALVTKDQALTADALALAELRRRAEVAEAARDRLTAAQAVQDGSGTPEAPTPDNPSGISSAGFWARVRRVFGGA